MKKICFLLCSMLVVSGAICATSDRAGRSVQAKMVAPAPRLTSLSGLSNYKPSMKQDIVVKVSADEPVAPADDDDHYDRSKERLACISNNLGLGNTFVWASKYSDTSNYSTMVEDTQNPENNVCFVLVGVRSEDDRIVTSDLPKKYFEWGQDVTCGSWIDDDMMEKRILDAKKTGRVLGTIGGGLGGATVGVGSMELFGNKLIGGAVEGQKSLEGVDLLVSQIKSLEPQAKTKFCEKIQELVRACSGATSGVICDGIKYLDPNVRAACK